jgi:hypothetical protein
MILMEGAQFANVYTKTLNVFQHALETDDRYGVKVVSPRAMETLEISPFLCSLTNPRSRLAYNEKRSFNLMHAINESLLLFADEPATLDDYPFVDMKPFSDDGNYLLGSYGYRVSPLLGRLLDMLRSDPDTRQAVMPIFQYGDLIGQNGAVETKDVPCTETIQFLIRDGKLDCFVNMRSNDFFWGFPYDVFQFTVMQEVMAMSLDIEIGTYYHYTASLHVYDRHYDWLKRINGFDPIEFRVDYAVGEMQWLCKSFQSLFAGKNDFFNGSNNSAHSLISNDIMPPFSTLLRNEYNYGSDLPVEPLDRSVEWANKFVKRWFKEEVTE